MIDGGLIELIKNLRIQVPPNTVGAMGLQSLRKVARQSMVLSRVSSVSFLLDDMRLQHWKFHEYRSKRC